MAGHDSSFDRPKSTVRTPTAQERQRMAEVSADEELIGDFRRIGGENILVQPGPGSGRFGSLKASVERRTAIAPFVTQLRALPSARRNAVIAKLVSHSADGAGGPFCVDPDKDLRSLKLITPPQLLIRDVMEMAFEAPVETEEPTEADTAKVETHSEIEGVL
ncbi:MAG: hypothetical protein AAB373_03550 [Patescibacteria group bacterium]